MPRSVPAINCVIMGQPTTAPDGSWVSAPYEVGSYDGTNPPEVYSHPSAPLSTKIKQTGVAKVATTTSQTYGAIQQALALDAIGLEGLSATTDYAFVGPVVAGSMPTRIPLS